MIAKASNVRLVNEQSVRDQEPRVGRPGVNPVSALPSDPSYVVPVQNLEYKAEASLHLLAPLQQHRRRCGDDDLADLAAEEQLAGNEPGLDCLADADVIGDKEVHPRQQQRLPQGFELVGVESNTRPEGRLEQPRIGRGNRIPPQRVDVGREVLGAIEAFGAEVAPCLKLQNLGIDLAFPEDVKRLSLSVVIDARKAYQGGIPRLRGLQGVLNEVSALANMDELPRCWGEWYRHHFAIHPLRRACADAEATPSSSGLRPKPVLHIQIRLIRARRIGPESWLGWAPTNTARRAKSDWMFAMSPSSTNANLSTSEVVRRISGNLLSRRPTLFAGPLGSFRGELVKKVADHHGKPLAEWFLFGPNPLDPDLPERVAPDQFIEGLRLLLLEDAVRKGQAPPDEPMIREMVALPPGWYERLADNADAVLLLRDLVPPTDPDDERLASLTTLLRERQFAGCRLGQNVTLVITTDPKRWESFRMDGFAASVELDVVRWAGSASTPTEFREMLESRDEDDPVAHVDVRQILSGDPP